METRTIKEASPANGYSKSLTMKTTIKDIMSVLKNDGRFQGNQKQLAAINNAIEKATGNRSDLVSFANEVKSLIQH